MIPFDFEYYRPDTIEEAYQIMRTSLEKKQKAVYYAGGTELVTNFRKGKDQADIVIDIKAIPDLMTVEKYDNRVIIGVGTPLNQIIDGIDFPAFTTVLEKIADHTTRNALSLGGNIKGRLPYKEAVLPLLAFNATAVIYGEDGVYEKPLRMIFDRTLKIKSDELLMQIKVDLKDLKIFSRRETEGTKVDYPILHAFVSHSDDKLFVGLSGFSSLPVYELFDLEALNVQPIEENPIYNTFVDQARACHRASVEYRQHLLKCALEDLLGTWKGGA